MTMTGLVLIPLTLILAVGDWGRLIVFLAVVSGLFSDAAVVNFSNFGIQPGYWVMLVVLARAAIELIVRQEPVRRDVLVRFLPMLVLIAASVVALFFASSFYEGGIIVQSSRDGQNGNGSLFHFRLENYAQHFYVVLNTLGALVVAHKVSRMSPFAISRLVNQALHGFIILSSVFVLWQWLHYTFGLYYPDKDFFHTNASYAQAYGQNMADFGYRLCGSFSEPSALAYYFSGALLFAYRQYEINRSTLALVGTALSILLLVISTSTSAYLIVSLFILRFAIQQAPRLGLLITDGSASFASRPSHTLFVLAAALGIIVFLLTHQDLVGFVVKTFIVDKPGTDSFSVRARADGLALKVAAETWGMGLGLGSHKANTLPMTLLSNTGVIGLFAFVWFVVGSFRSAQAACRRTPALASAIRPTQWFLIGLLIQHCFMNPNFNMAMFWAVAGVLVGASFGTTQWAEFPARPASRFEPVFPSLPHSTV